MIQADKSDSQSVRSSDADTPSTVVMIADDADRIATARAVVHAIDDRIEIVHTRDPADVITPDAGAPVALYCLWADDDALSTQRALALLRTLAGPAPILLIDTGNNDPALNVEAAIAGGAWDCVSATPSALLRARLGQALELGTARLDLRSAGQQLHQTQRRLEVLLSDGQDARARLSGHQIIESNAAMARLIGVGDPQAVQGIDLLDCVTPADRDRLSEAFDTTATERKQTTLVCNLKTGTERPYSVRALILPDNTDTMENDGLSIALQPAESARTRPGETRRHPVLDGRMALHAVLAAGVGQTLERRLGLIFVTVDGVAELQTQMGIADSDLMLQEAGLFLLHTMRGADRVFRFNAGEYVLLIERYSRTEINDAAESLQVALGREQFGDGTMSAVLTATVTSITLDTRASDNDERLQIVMDRAYAIRADGGDRYEDCSPRIRTADAQPAEATQAWITRLRDALSTDDRFSLAYQGITSLAGDSQPYFDVLLRYIDERGALIRPGEFLPAAEQGELMPDVDQWVIKRAIEVIWRQRNQDVSIALFVKLSTATMTRGGPFMRWLEQAITPRPIPRHNLIFSFREEDIRQHQRAARTLAGELDAEGFRIALTHFGNTPKALAVLERFPAAFVKLSPEFARQVIGGREDDHLAHIIAKARERQIPLVAEHIEDANSMARLWQAGVNYVQGHFIQEPDTQAIGNV